MALTASLARFAGQAKQIGCAWAQLFRAISTARKNLPPTLDGEMSPSRTIAELGFRRRVGDLEGARKKRRKTGV